MTHSPGVLTTVRAHILAGIIGHPIALCLKSQPTDRFNVSSADAQVNAQRFAHCWNCHDDLVAALESLTKTYLEYRNRNDPLWIDVIGYDAMSSHSLQQATAAIAKAKAKGTEHGN